MSNLKVNTIEPYSGGTVTITGAVVTNATSASYAETANTLTPGDKTISGSVTVTGSALRKSVVAGAYVTATADNVKTAYLSGFSGGYTTIYNGANDHEFGIVGDSNAYSGDWSGSGIINNADPGNSYQTVIGFQDKSNYTDNTVTMRTPVDMKQGLHVTGSVNVTGSILQKFTVPAPNNQIDLMTVEGATANSHPYDYVNLALADFPSYGALYEDTYLYEAYDSLGYNYGSEFKIGGAGGGMVVFPFGGGTVGVNNLDDQNDGTTRLYQQASLIKQIATTSYQISGSVSLKDTMTLAQQATLPAGAVGELAVSASNLYYHNGSTWSQIN